MILASLELLMLPASLLGTDFAAAVKVPNVNRITNSASFVATVGVYNVCVVFPAVVFAPAVAIVCVVAGLPHDSTDAPTTPVDAPSALHCRIRQIQICLHQWKTHQPCRL